MVVGFAQVCNFCVSFTRVEIFGLRDTDSTHLRKEVPFTQKFLFTISIIMFLLDCLGDNNPHSKKDSEIRRKELFEIAAPTILKHLLENLNDLIQEGGTR